LKVTHLYLTPSLGWLLWNFAEN